MKTAPVWGRIVRNLTWIFSSQGVIALLGIVSLTLTARALGAGGLGVLAMIEAYTRIFSRLFHWEPWQAAIGAGADALEQGDHGRLGRLLGLARNLDLAGGMLAAGLAVALAPAFANLKAMQGYGPGLLILGAAGISVALKPTALATLRLYDRFDVLAKTDMAIAVFRVVLAGLAYLVGLGVTGFVIVLVLVTLADGIVPYLLARLELRRHGVIPVTASPRRVMAENPGAAPLFWNSNCNVILRQMTQRLDVIFLGAFLGPAQIGFYHLAKRIGEAALRLGRPLSQVIYPELTRLAVRGEFRRLGRMVAMVSAGIFGLLLVALVPVLMNIEWILRHGFGESFLPATLVVTIQGIAVLIFLAGINLGPALMSLGRSGAMLATTAITTMLFFILLIPMTMKFGVEGASATHLIVNTIWFGSCATLTFRATHHATHRLGIKI